MNQRPSLSTIRTYSVALFFIKRQYKTYNEAFIYCLQPLLKCQEFSINTVILEVLLLKTSRIVTVSEFKDIANENTRNSRGTLNNSK